MVKGGSEIVNSTILGEGARKQEWTDEWEQPAANGSQQDEWETRKHDHQSHSDSNEWPHPAAGNEKAGNFDEWSQPAAGSEAAHKNFDEWTQPASFKANADDWSQPAAGSKVNDFDEWSQPATNKSSGTDDWKSPVSDPQTAEPKVSMDSTFDAWNDKPATKATERKDSWDEW